MNTIEHYLTILGEECHEIVIAASNLGQRASKSLRLIVKSLGSRTN